MIKEIIIDGTNAVSGRLSSYIAKQLLLGAKVNVVNAEKAVIIGVKRSIIEEYKHRRDMHGGIFRGPNPHSMPDRMLKKIVRGMLPHNRRGKALLKNLKCYKGMPAEFEDKKKILAGKIKTKKFITLQDLGREIGGTA